MKEVVIRSIRPGNAGNTMFLYLAALKLSQKLSNAKLANFRISQFGIDIPDADTYGKAGLHISETSEHLSMGKVPFETIIHLCEMDRPDVIHLEGYCQHAGNLPDRRSVAYNELFPRLAGFNRGGREHELVISIRGGEILRAVDHPHYVLLPIAFYKSVVASTGLDPIFFGQLEDNPYSLALRAAFPDAQFIPGTSPAEDFEFIRRSRNVLPSVSTFAWMAAWLSDADKVILPLSGLLNPLQNKASFFVPEDDKRFEYYMFPFNYWTHVDQYNENARSMHGKWEKISEHEVVNRVNHLQHQTPVVDDYARLLDPDFYVTTHKDFPQVRARFGDCALYNHYLDAGFREGARPFRLDRAWYCRTYPHVALALSQAKFRDEYHHYACEGSRRGYRPTPP